MGNLASQRGAAACPASFVISKMALFSLIPRKWSASKGKLLISAAIHLAKVPEQRDECTPDLLLVSISVSLEDQPSLKVLKGQGLPDSKAASVHVRADICLFCGNAMFMIRLSEIFAQEPKDNQEIRLQLQVCMTRAISDSLPFKEPLKTSQMHQLRGMRMRNA